MSTVGSKKVIGDSNKKFKLVLGLGNNSLEQISRLCQIYSQAGADIFDLSPNVNSLAAAREGVLNAGLNPDDFQYCISFGVKGDKHIKKAFIDDEKCLKCLECIKSCPQDAIFVNEDTLTVDETKCIGCARCEKLCTGQNGCISFYDAPMDIQDIARCFKGEKIDMVEFHISSDDKQDIIKNWELILKNFAGSKYKKSICTDRSNYGDEELLKFIQQLLSMNPEKTIIQADGVAMSGSCDKSSTLQAVSHAQIYKNSDAEIFISGGTNHHTKHLAQEMDVRFEGITMGSYAREAVKSADMTQAVEIAKSIVNSVRM